MCGRFTFSPDPGTFLDEFHLREGIPGYTRRYNIAPGQDILVVTGGPAGRYASWMRWGLIPRWAGDQKTGYKMINARAETIDQKPAFKNAFLRRRCLIPADGFYEWKKTGGRKQPMRIVVPGKAVFAFAGIWDRWNSPDGKEIRSCSIITTEAGQSIREIHNRMPVIFAAEEEYAAWLGVQDTTLLKGLLKPYGKPLRAYPVSPAVNSAGVDKRELIEPSGGDYAL
ncbi:MAG: SOS response-associated peptidase [Peptococcaceae bacterium]|nr:SOS response-associated peptidase [Peptococcaceae bacterium]